MFFKLGQTQLGLLSTGWCDSTKGILSCLAVANSSWSSIGGIPLVFFGLSYVTLSMVGLFALKLNFWAFVTRFRPLIITAGLLSLLLLIIQGAVIQRLCLGCVILDFYFMTVALIARKPEPTNVGATALAGALIVAGAFGWQKLLTPHLTTSLSDLKKLEQDWAEVSPKPELKLEYTTFSLGEASAVTKKRVLMILDPRCEFCSENMMNLDTVGKKLAVGIDLDVLWRPADAGCNEDSIPGHEGGCYLSKLFMCLPQEKRLQVYQELHGRPSLGARDLLEKKKVALVSYPVFSPEVEACVLSAGAALQEQVKAANSVTHLAPVSWVSGLRINGAIEERKWIYLLTREPKLDKLKEVTDP